MKRWMTTDPSPEQPATQDRMDNHNKIDRSAEQPTTKLYEAIREGDQYAFSRYYETSLDRLVTLVTRITKDSEEARNIAQDTFIKLWQQRGQIDPAQSLDGFVSTVAWNAALDFLKRKQAHARFHDEQMYTQSAEDISGEEELIATETGRRIENIVHNMPPQRRRVFEMSRVEHLTYNQIAERMMISHGTVHRHMKLALQELRYFLSLLLFWLFMH